MWETLQDADLLLATSIFQGSQYPGVIAHYCDEMNELLKPGTRELDIMVPPSLQRQVFPTKKRIERGFKAAKAITDADQMIFKSDAGTNLTMNIAGRRGGCQVSYVDNKEHRWDNYGYDAAYAGPIEDGTNGVLVLDQGDLITSAPGIQFVLDKMKVTFKKGYVTDITGGYSAKSYDTLLKRVTRNGKDKEGYGTSHIGWNLSYEATIGAGQRSDLGAYHHSAAGLCMIALGTSHGLDGGATAGFFSTRVAQSHSHFAAYNMDVWLDDLQIMKKGEIIAEGF
jgi:2,5-dihydroxypyridine 5,6-dioxygenase